MFGRFCSLLCLALFALTDPTHSYCGSCRYYLQDVPGLIPCAPTPEPRNTSVQCTIKKNGNVIFNKTILWENANQEGLIIDKIVYKDWHNVTVENSLEDAGSCSYRICLDRPYETSPDKFFQYPNGKTLLECPLPWILKNRLTPDQFLSFTANWYHNGRVIPTNKTTYEYNSKFQDLEINGATFQSTPGNYSCIIEYEGKKLLAKEYQACVKDRPSCEDFDIQSMEGKIRVPPGANVTLTCNGTQTCNTANVIWERKDTNGTWSEICSVLSYSCKTCTDEACKECCKERVKNLDPDGFCYTGPTQEEITGYRFNIGRYTAQLHLTNLSLGENVMYRCKVEGSDKIGVTTLIVRKETKDPQQLKITLSTVAGCIALVGVIILILKFFQLEFKYFVKRYLTDFEISNQPATYLVYSDDAFSGQDRNPLKDITSWLKAQNYKFYDPNSPDSYTGIGESVASTSRKVLEKCLSITVILTPNLLNDNTIETVNSYVKGFEDNVTRDFPVIFLCTLEMKKKIFKQAANFEKPNQYNEAGMNKDVIVTFAHFMKRNTVIRWELDHHTTLHRSLYVALPKVKPQL